MRIPIPSVEAGVTDPKFESLGAAHAQIPVQDHISND
jgi:hypothetical protein